MTREDVRNQIAELKNADDHDDPEIVEEITLFEFALSHMTDNEWRLSQLRMPGRRSILCWAEDHMEVK